MTKLEKLNSLISTLKTKSGDNYTEIESVVTEISSLGSDLFSDYTNEVEAHKATTSESIKRKKKIAELQSTTSEKDEELKKLEEYKAEIEQRDTKIGSLESRLKDYDNDVINKYKERHEKFKISESDYKKYFDLPEKIDDLTVEQARQNNKELDKLIELGVFKSKQTDTGTPQFHPDEKEFDLNKIYNKS